MRVIHRLVLIAMLAIVLGGLVACESSGSASGGGSENRQHAHFKLGLPF